MKENRWQIEIQATQGTIGRFVGKVAASMVFMLGVMPAHAVTYYYQSSALTGTANWNTMRNGGGSVPSNFTTAGNTFVIQDAQSPTLGGSWTISGAGSGLLIETGGTMTTGANNPTLTLNMQSGANYIVNNTTWANLTFGTVDSASTFTVTGAATTLIDRAYGNLVWQASGGNNVTPGNNLTTTGNFSINSGAQLRTATTTTSRVWTIGGSLNINSTSTWVLTNVTDGNAATATINIAGGLANSGTIQKNTLNTAATVNFNGSGSSTVQWGTVNNTNFLGVTFNVASSKAIVFTDSLNQGAATFNVSGTLNMGTQVLSGASGTFSLASGATLITSNATGLDGSITVTGARTFSTGANYEFRGASTGTLLPSTVNNLTINRSSGNVALDGGSATQTVSGTLGVLSGNLEAGATTNTVAAGALVMRDTQINSGVTTTLSGNATFDAANNGTAVIAGPLGLGGSVRTFIIADGSASSDMTISGQISNGGITKTGAGALTLSGSNSFTGATTISSGTLAASAGGGSALGGTSGVTIASGGTLLLGAANQINNTGAMSLGGGTFNTGGFSEGTLSSDGIGTLTLSANSTLDLGSGASTVTFAGFTPGGSTLNILNWTEGSDHLVFSEDQTSNLSFFNFNGFGATQNDLGGGFFEIVPVPEPATIICGIILLGVVLWRDEKHIRKLLRGRRRRAAAPATKDTPQA